MTPCVRAPTRHLRNGRQIGVELEQAAARAKNRRFVGEPLSGRLVELVRPVLGERGENGETQLLSSLDDSGEASLGKHMVAVDG